MRERAAPAGRLGGVTHVLAIDLGSTGIKIAVVDPDGVVQATAGEVIPLVLTDDGGVEQDPEGWWSALGRCAQRAVHGSGLDASLVRLVAVTSQFMSTTPVDEHGHPLGNTVMWMDSRGARHRRVRPPREEYPRMVEVHGLVPSGNDDAGHVDLIRALHPDVFDRTHAFLEPMDALVARLTGRVTATQNTVFPMLVCDNRTWGATAYDEGLLALTGMPADKLAPLQPMGEPRGAISAAAALHLGISPDAVVADATLDSVTSAVGTGAISADRCGLVIGTTAVMVTHLPSKRHDIEHGLTAAPSPLPSSWFLMAENGIGGKALDVFVNNMVFADDGLGRPADDGAYQSVLDAAATSPCGSNGVMFLPWLVGSMAPGNDRRQRGGFVNIGLATTRADMSRAVLEGVAMNAAWLLPHFGALAGHRHDEIVLGGGGARSSLWGQIVADATGRRVRRLADPTVTNAHGAALLALSQHGGIALDDVPSMLRVAQVHEPDDAHHRLLDARRQVLVEFHDRMSDAYAALDRA